MAQLILRHDNGEEEILNHYAPDNGYITMKFCSDEDILDAIEENPDATNKTFEYIDRNDLKDLNERTGSEQEIINYAVDRAIEREKNG